MDQGYPYWRSVVSFLLDFICVFLIFGFLVGYLTGSNTAAGGEIRFNLNGMPALILLALVVAYFIIFNRFLGGTVWRRILGVAPRN